MTTDGPTDTETALWLMVIESCETHDDLDLVGVELVDAGHDTPVLRGAGQVRRARLGPRPRPLPARKPGEDAVTARDREHSRRVAERKSARSA